MKFVVEIHDCYIEDGELAEAIKTQIMHDVVRQLTSKIRESSVEAISKQVTEMMTQRMSGVINDAISEFVEAGVITVNSKQIPIVDHLRAIFEKGHGWNDPSEKMAALAKKFGEQCKAQYNNIFAGKIVVAMKEQGYLKDDIAKVLLGESK